MIEAYEIGIRLALDDGVSAGVDAIRRDLAELNIAVDASLANLARLREAAASVVAPMAPESARQTIPVLDRPAGEYEPAGPASAFAAVAAAVQAPRPQDAPVAAMPAMASAPEPIRPVHEPQATVPETEPLEAAASAAPRRADERRAPEAGAAPLVPAAEARQVSPTSAKPNAQPPPRPFLSPLGAVTAPEPMEPTRTRVSPAEPAAPATVRKLPPEPPPERPVPQQSSPDRSQASSAARRVERQDSVVGDPRPFPQAIAPIVPTSARPQTEAASLSASPAAPAFAPVPPRSPPPAAAGAPVARRLDAATPEPTPPRQVQPDQNGMNVHLYLDGALLGRWMNDHLGRAASRPFMSSTAFDPRVGPTWPGAPIG